MNALELPREKELFDQYLPLVHKVISRLRQNLPIHIKIKELYSFGEKGLISAIRKYDPRCGSSFETIATTHIRCSVLGEVRRKCQSRDENITEVSPLPPNSTAASANISRPNEDLAALK